MLFSEAALTNLPRARLPPIPALLFDCSTFNSLTSCATGSIQGTFSLQPSADLVLVLYQSGQKHARGKIALWLLQRSCLCRAGSSARFIRPRLRKRQGGQNLTVTPMLAPHFHPRGGLRPLPNYFSLPFPSPTARVVRMKQNLAKMSNMRPSSRCSVPPARRRSICLVTRSLRG